MMQLIAFSMGNVDHARNLWRIEHFYFSVKSRREWSSWQKVALIPSFQSLGNHCTPLSEGSSSSLMYSSTRYVSLSICN